MPNHVHLLLSLIRRDPRLKSISDCVRCFGRLVPGTVGTIINAYKGAVTKAACRLVGERFSLWQEEFVDTLIRNRAMLEHKRRYIIDNPARWEEKHRVRARL